MSEHVEQPSDTGSVASHSYPPLWRRDYEVVGGTWIPVEQHEIYGWAAVERTTGKVALDTFEEFNDSLRELPPGWIWQKFIMVASG